MIDKTETRKLYRKFFLKSIPLYILVAFTFVTFACSFGLYAEYSRDDAHMDIDNVIQADVTHISPIPYGADSHGYTNNWNVYYEYDDGSFSYKGSVVVSGRETAETYIGKQIPIYVDGQGHSIAVSHYNWRQESGATQRALIIGIVYAIFFGIFSGLSIFLYLRKRHKIKAQTTDCGISEETPETNN